MIQKASGHREPLLPPRAVAVRHVIHPTATITLAMRLCYPP